MAVAYLPGKFKYVLKDERKAAKEGKEHTVFLLKALSARELEDLEASISLGMTFSKDEKGGEVTGSQEIKPGEKVNAFLRIGLCGWENFKDAKGNEVEFKKEESTGMASWDSINMVVPYRFELYNAIEDGNTVSQDEAKNS